LCSVLIAFTLHHKKANKIQYNKNKKQKKRNRENTRTSHYFILRADGVALHGHLLHVLMRELLLGHGLFQLRAVLLKTLEADLFKEEKNTEGRRKQSKEIRT
jgi:hypothetical protein